MDADVVVVGAGLSGLVAARDLTRAGLDVVVLESADRVGGRAYSETTALGSRVDLGGQWIGHDHHRLEALVDELGATRYPMETGLLPKLVDGTRSISPFSPAGLGAVAAMAALDVARRRCERSSTTSVRSWIDKAPRRSRRLLEVIALISWTADLDRISLATATSAVRAQHGVLTMISTKGGAQDSLVAQGIGFLADRLAEDLDVRLSTRVQGIERSDDEVVVRTTGDDLRARAVVVTAPSPTAARIAHDPPLPPARQALEQQTFMGSVYKAIAVYERPFWREQGRGELMMLDHPGCAVFDSTSPGGPGHLTLLVGGDEARTLDELTTEQRRLALLSRVAVHLGQGVLEPVGWHEKSWHLDPHAGGGYLALPDLGADASGIPMSSEPVGRVHWAGTETASDHPGYFDGAIESGQRVAREVAEVLHG